MIKHGSGMASCLKYVTNKVPSVAPLVIRRSHVSVCSRQLSKSSFTSPLIQEIHGISDASTPLLPSDCLSIKNSVSKQGKVLTLKCDSDVIRYISYLIFDCDGSRPIETRQLLTPRQCSAIILGVPYNGTLDDFRQSEILYSHYSNYYHEKKGLDESFLCCSGAAVQNSTSESGKDVLNSQRTSNTTSEDSFKPPSGEQLAHVEKTLANNLPRFFTQPLDMSIYHPNITFEDNIRGKRFFGRGEYNLQAKLLYIIGHLRFMYIKLDVLKITSHPEDGTVKVRWKISVFKLRKLYRLNFFNISKSLQEANDTWIDGFSTYYVLGDGLVHKHIADKMIPDTDQMLKKTEAPKAVPAVPLAYRSKV